MLGKLDPPPAMFFKVVTISDKWAPIGRITTTCHADNAAGRISPEFTVGYQRVLQCILPHTILQHFMGPVCPGIVRSLKSLQSYWSRLACGAYLLQSQRQNIKRPEQAASAVYTPVLTKKAGTSTSTRVEVPGEMRSHKTGAISPVNIN